MKDSEKTKEQLIDELVELRHRTSELKASEAQRKHAQERIEHLNLVLRVIRNVHRVITHEKDQESLLKGICDRLTETRGYYNAWVALIDKAGRLVTTAEAGLGSDFLPMLEKLKRGELTACGQKALSYSGVVVVEDPPSTCVDCPLSAKYGGRGAMTVRLEHEGKVYGLVSLSIPRALIAEEEQTLFQEFAGDIAFALRGAELEQERKRAEETLRASEEKYRALFEGAPDGVEVLDRQGNIVDWNRAEELLLGYSREEIIGKHFTAFLPEESKELLRQNFSVVKEVGYSDCECKLMRKDGSTISAWRKSRALYDENKELIGVVVHVLTQEIWDISRKQQGELIQAYVNQNPNARLEQLGNFLGVSRQRAQMVLKLLGTTTQRQQARKGANALHSRGGGKGDYSPQTLTGTETKVLRYMARGDGNMEIARALNVSPRTIRNHITSILAKLSADNRTQAVVLAVQQGVISLEEVELVSSP